MDYTHEQIRQACVHDPNMHALVHSMINGLEQCKLTPAELRAIAVFAATEWERRKSTYVAFGKPNQGA